MICCLFQFLCYFSISMRSECVYVCMRAYTDLLSCRTCYLHFDFFFSIIFFSFDMEKERFSNSCCDLVIPHKRAKKYVFFSESKKKNLFEMAKHGQIERDRCNEQHCISKLSIFRTIVYLSFLLPEPTHKICIILCLGNAHECMYVCVQRKKKFKGDTENSYTTKFIKYSIFQLYSISNIFLHKSRRK